jgi:hypothetical protein
MSTEEMREQLQNRVCALQCDLSSHVSAIGDWKVIKCYEAKLKGEELPYDLNALMAQRQAVRDEINRLQEQLNNLQEPQVE